MTQATWKLQDAKARFSEVVRRAKQEGPQHVTVHGREEVVVLSTDDYAQFRRDRGTDSKTGLDILKAFQDPRFTDFAFKREPVFSPVRETPDFNDPEFDR
jgi:prevent-host-death family protein